MKPIQILALAAIGYAVYSYSQTPAPTAPVVPPPPVNPPGSQQPSNPNYMKWLKWASVAIAIFGIAKKQWEPGGIFYNTPVPEYDAGSQFWQDVSNYA